MHTVRRLLRILSFPLLFGGAGLIGWLAYAPTAIFWLMPLLVGGVLALSLLLERIIPFQLAWNRGPGMVQDAAYLGLTQLSVLLAESSAWALVVVLAGSLDGLAVWPQSWPLIAQLALALALGDLLPYLYHRLSHETHGFLWRVHAVHHAPERLYSLNFARFHPLNAFLTAALTLLPLALLGAPAPVLFVAAVLHNVHGVLSHANVDLRLGPLNWIFSMAELHRWHHASDLTQANGNYGATVLLWDWLLRTRRAPAAQVAATDIGLSAGSAGTVPDHLCGQLLTPFAPRAAARCRPRCCPAAPA